MSQMKPSVGPKASLPVLSWILGTALLAIPGQLSAQASGDDYPTYKAGPITIMKMGFDLFQALTPEQQPKISIEPLGVDFPEDRNTADTPYLRSVELRESPNDVTRKVYISEGFVDLMNHVAHAKAIDRIERGYFRKYLALLGQAQSGQRIPELPGLQDKRFWTEDMMNEQLSNFYQMVGIVVGIELSHHYLGHFDKYRNQLANPSGPPVPMNRFLSKDEWKESVLRGAWNALQCGYGIDGVVTLYESIDKVSERPTWMEYFLPEKTRYRSLRRDLQRIERDFFAGKDL